MSSSVAIVLGAVLCGALGWVACELKYRVNYTRLQDQHDRLAMDYRWMHNERERIAGVLAGTRGSLQDMVNQFAYEGVKDGKPHISTGGLSALEGAFATLGLDDPTTREALWENQA